MKTKGSSVSKGEMERAGGPLVDLERRRISALAALALLGGATITLTSCGSGGSPQAPSTQPPGGSCPADAACGLVTGDPSHSAIITSAELAAGGALVLDIRGNANHTHTVELSAEDVAAIRDKRHVDKVSSETLSHQHGVIFN